MRRIIRITSDAGVERAQRVRDLLLELGDRQEAAEKEIARVGKEIPAMVYREVKAAFEYRQDHGTQTFPQWLEHSGAMFLAQESTQRKQETTDRLVQNYGVVASELRAECRDLWLKLADEAGITHDMIQFYSIVTPPLSDGLVFFVLDEAAMFAAKLLMMSPDEPKQ